MLDQYSSSDGARIRAWTRISPDRVTYKTNVQQTEIISYKIDGLDIPTSGVGSIIVFSGLDEGVLNRAGRTIRAAQELEKAAELYAKEPVPTMVLKSNGTNLTPERITKLLESWKVARNTRATAFLNADVELNALGFDPAKLQLNEARMYVSLKCKHILLLVNFFHVITRPITFSLSSNSYHQQSQQSNYSFHILFS